MKNQEKNKKLKKLDYKKPELIGFHPKYIAHGASCLIAPEEIADTCPIKPPDEF